MRKISANAGRRGATIALSAVLAMGTAATTVPAYAQETGQATQSQEADGQVADSATDVSSSQVETQDAEAEQGIATQDAEATTQADLDNATEGSTVELKGTITTDLTVNKKLTITAASDAVMKGKLTINANDVTVSGVHFTLDGTTGASDSLRNSGKTGLNVKGCTFDITSDADAQLNSVWLGYGANDATFEGNYFYIDLPVTDNSYVAINIVGATVKNTTVSKNQVLYRGNSEPVGSAHFLIANGNKSDAGQYGLSGLKVTDNSVANITGLSADKSQTYGVGVSNAADAVISGNTFNGLYIAVKPSMWPNEAPSKSIELTSNMFTGSYVGIMMRTSDVEPGAVVSKDNNLYSTTIPYAGLNGDYALIWQSDDGHLYPDVNSAASAGKTSLTLVTNLNLGSAANVDDGQDVTIDLDGHKLNGSLTNNGTLTIKDSAGLDGAVSSVEIDGTGKTVLMGGTYDSNPYDKGFFGENSEVADGYDTLVRVREDDGSYKYTVLPKDEVLKNAKAQVETKDGTLFFETTEEANSYAEKNGLGADAVKPVTSVETPSAGDDNGGTNGNADDNGATSDGNAGSDANNASGNADKGASNTLPQTGDSSLAGIAALGAAGAVALGAGIAASRRHDDA